MRLLVTAVAALLAVTASAQTSPAPEAPTPADQGVAAPSGPVTPPAAAPVTPPAAAPAKEGFTIKSGADTLLIYGLIDLTVSSVDNANAAGKRKIAFQTPWFSGSRWGFQARHGVRDGFDVIAKLEGEYVVATGAMDTANVIFNRDAWVGFAGATLGQLTFGRQNTLARDFSQNFGDAYGSAGVRMDEGGWTNTNNFKALLFYAGSATGTRLDNGIVWKKKAGDFMLGLSYQLGGVTDHPSQNGTLAAGLAWNGGPYNASGYFTQANVLGRIHRAFAIGGNVQPISLVRLNVGFFHYTANQGTLAERKDNAFTVSTKISPDPAYDFEVGYQVMKTTDGGYNAAGTSTLNAFADTSAVTAVASGNRKALYGSAFYHLDKRADLYLAADRLTLTDGYKVAATNGHKNQTELAAGLRFKF